MEFGYDFTDYGDIGRPVLLLEGYKEELRESGSSSDFPTYLDNKIQKIFMERYERAPSAWMNYVKNMSLIDFKLVPAVTLTGMPELTKVPEGGEYKDSNITEIAGPTIKLGKFGRTFSLTWETIVNDDLNRFREIPEMMAEAAAMTLNLDVVVNTLEANPNAYDGTAFFHATHNNLSSTALSEAELAANIIKMRTQVDTENRRLNIAPKWLVIPPQLEFVARRILADAPVYQPGTGLVGENVVKGIVEYLIEPYFADANNWYLFADPSRGRAAMAAGFLNGETRPSVYLQDPSIRLLMGGLQNNPYSFEFDEIHWKVRHVWAVRMWEWRAAQAAIVA